MEPVAAGHDERRAGRAAAADARQVGRERDREQEPAAAVAAKLEPGEGERERAERRLGRPPGAGAGVTSR